MQYWKIIYLLKKVDPIFCFSMIMSFDDFIHEYNLKFKATANVNIQHILSSVVLDGVKIYLRDGPFSSGVGLSSLHLTKGTHWAAYNNQNYIDSNGCSTQKPPRFIIKWNGHCLHFGYKVQALDFCCVAYCLNIINLTKNMGTDYVSAFLNL